MLNLLKMTKEVQLCGVLPTEKKQKVLKLERRVLFWERCCSLMCTSKILFVLTECCSDYVQREANILNCLKDIQTCWILKHFNIWWQSSAGVSFGWGVFPWPKNCLQTRFLQICFDICMRKMVVGWGCLLDWSTNVLQMPPPAQTGQNLPVSMSDHWHRWSAW